MTDLIPRDAAIAAMEDEADRCDDAVKWGGSRQYIQDCKAAAFAMRSRVPALRAIPAIDPAAIREAALWDLLEEIDAQINLAEEISPEFADKVKLALWAGQTKGAAE